MSICSRLRPYQRLQLLLICLVSSASAAPKNIWHVSIFEAPAPPPGKGAPIQASAVRDKAYLPAQIGSIVGAYVLSVVIISSALLFVGRRLRRAAEASPKTLAMEMMKPAVRPDVPKAFDPSPITPGTNPYGKSPNSAVDTKNMWPSPNKLGTGKEWTSPRKTHSKQPSVQSSVVTFDESVIEDDRAKAEKEMERLYAAVVEHDEKKSSGKDSDEPKSQYPPELQHLKMPQVSTQPVSDPLHIDTKSPARTTTRSPRKNVRPSPITTHSRTSSRSSLGSFSKRRGVRDLPISPPMGSPDLASQNNSVYGESEPLSPRQYYDPGPPPPTPPTRNTSNASLRQFDSSRFSPRRAEYGDSLRTPRTPNFSIPSVPEVSYQEDHEPRYEEDNASQRDQRKTKRQPPPTLRTNSNVESTTGSTATLPLRNAPLPLRSMNSSANNTRPPSMIKATVIERKVPERRANAATPRTGVPMTPYSPYMPYTPLTPLTPSRLVSREERKRKEKEEGRRVATIEDAVEEEGEMWGDAYP